MFCSQTGEPLGERNVGRSWDRLRRKAQKAGVCDAFRRRKPTRSAWRSAASAPGALSPVPDGPPLFWIAAAVMLGLVWWAGKDTRSRVSGVCSELRSGLLGGGHFEVPSLM